MVVDGLDDAERDLVVGLVRGLDDASHPVIPAGGRDLLGLLRDAGVLVRHRAAGGRGAGVRPGAPAETAEAWALLPDPARPPLADGWARLAGRRRRAVRVCGTGRVAELVADGLRQAGVGRVDLAETFDPRGVAPSANPRSPRRLDLVVLVEHLVADAGAAAPLMGADLAHLSVVVRPGTLVVGPLVVPGRGACLRCLDLYRAERDPAWPRLLAQLLAGARYVPQEELGSRLASSLASLQVLAHLDAPDADPADPTGSESATLEITLPGGLVRRRNWPVHPGCGCRDLPGE